MTADNNSQNTDEFYRGYAKIPPGYKNFLLKFIPLLMLGVIAFAIVVPIVHDQFNRGGVKGKQELEGLLVAEPVPHLLVPRPGNTAGGSKFSSYLLSGPGKTAPKQPILDLVGQWVKLNGTVVSRNNMTVIAAKGAEAIAPPEGAPTQPEAGKSLGEFSLVGEIVDAKCYPGVMKPGRTKTHRGCAIRCIAGGVPAAFVVENSNQDVMYFLLADSQGKGVNKWILNKIADPIRITGEVIQYGDLFVLQADPKTYQFIS